MFGSPEKKAEKAHRKAMKQIRWALKTGGVTEDEMVGAMGDPDENMMLLTGRDVIWVGRGVFGRARELGRVGRDQVLGVRRESTSLVFTIEGGSLPKGNRFPYSDQFLANAFSFLDALCGGNLVERMTPEERENPLTFMRELVLEFPRDEPGSAPKPAPAPAASEDIPETIRKLGELRDAGLLTTEEFDVKKQELLGRM